MAEPTEVTTPQLLHLVIGGSFATSTRRSSATCPRSNSVGAFGSYDEARRAWKARAQATVDNALMRYFILHAHRLIDPRGDTPLA